MVATAAIGLALAAQAAAPIAAADRLLPRAAELRAIVHAECTGCAWDVAGREAVTLTIAVDGTYSQHLVLVRPGRANYEVMLGRAAAGRHRVTVEIDQSATAAGLRGDAAATASLTLSAVEPGGDGYTALSLAPFVYARADTVGRFTDTPVFMWYEVERRPNGARYRYSLIFTNEDGGTPADRLMATWGRTTDIEYIYSVEVDSGRIVAEDHQGPDHKVLPFAGRREGRHPLLWVATSNNMVSDAGETAIRYAPLPRLKDLRNASREIVMDANPWLYALTAQELRREGKIADDPPPGRGTIPDPRRFVYVEACAEVGKASLSVSAGRRSIGAARGAPAGAPDQWTSSDRGLPRYRIARDGCFRAAIPVPAGTRPGDVAAVRIAAFDGPVTLTRINTVFMLDESYVPGPSLLRWTGSQTIEPDTPFEVSVRR